MKDLLNGIYGIRGEGISQDGRGKMEYGRKKGNSARQRA
jgi:hypothetical protein